MERDSFPNAFSAEPADAGSSAPASPCIRVCTLDDDRVCKGCRRTVEEIVAWPRMTAAEQERLLAELALRQS